MISKQYSAGGSCCPLSTDAILQRFQMEDGACCDKKNEEK